MNAFVLNELMDVLEKETALYEDILKISRNKTRVVVEGKIQELDSIVKVEQNIVLQIGRLEDKREELVARIRTELGLDSEQITISEIVKHVPEEQAVSLKASQEKMVNTLGELKNVNDLNSKLIRNSLDYIDFSVNLISAADISSNNYGESGQVNETKKRNLFDVKL